MVYAWLCRQDEGRVAVLFNKYALENDGAPAEDTNRGSLNGASDREQRLGGGSRLAEGRGT